MLNSDSTPDVTYTYDNVTNGIGRLTKVSNANSETHYTAFDPMGRVTAHKQRMNSTDFTTAYTYNRAGALLEETYPSGRMVRNTLASNGQLSQVETKPSGGSYANRASSFTYSAPGAVSSLQLGNGKYETTLFNSRLQPTQIGLGTSTTDTSLLKLEYGYGTTANNGNVLSQTITVPGLTYTFDQTYTYDTLNRLATAAETYNGAQTWSQTFGYDRYGNRNITAGTGQTNLSFDATTNKITTSGYTYDSVGNTTADPSGMTFTYDAENKQLTVANGGGTLGAYLYDGDGKRVKKYNTSPTDNRLFIYDAAGKLIEERSTTGQYAIQTSYVYAGARLLSVEHEKSSTTSYLTADPLGSPRINTDGSGNVTSRDDYLPFGESITSAITSQRTSGLGYVADSVRKQFTGYERDGESGLDFAQARMFASSYGRFSSPDPLLASSKQVLPQSWNRYSYVLNNPLMLIDPTGMVWGYYEEKGKRYFRWFDGDAGQHKGKNYKEWTGSSILNFKGIGTVQLLDNGRVARVRSRPAPDVALRTGNSVRDLTSSVTSHPQFRALEKLTNPDSVSLSASTPFGGPGASFWVTKNYDFGYSYSFGITPTDMKAAIDTNDISRLFKPRGLMGSLSVSASFISEMDIRREDRLSFATGTSLNTMGCYYLCGGITNVTGPMNRTSYNLGFSPGVSLNQSISNSEHRGNLYEKLGLPIPDHDD